MLLVTQVPAISEDRPRNPKNFPVHNLINIFRYGHAETTFRYIANRGYGREICEIWNLRYIANTVNWPLLLYASQM